MPSTYSRQTLRANLLRSGCSLMLCSALFLTGCQHSQPRTTLNEQEVRAKLAPLPMPDPAWSSAALRAGPQSTADNCPINDETSATPQHADIWTRIRAGYQLQDEFESNPRIDRHRLWYASRTTSLEIIAKRSTPYIHHIVEALDKRNMPLELALLPAIESAFNPRAQSASRAAGLWQFIPSTGRNFKLKQTHWYDGRQDVIASTEAALDYLEYLHKMFDGDWLLALAAYNAGEGTVSRAIKRNRGLGLATDYWNLQLSQQARDYVPRLLALARIIGTPKAYTLALPNIPDEPYFVQVPLRQQVKLTQIADLARVPSDQLHDLNPAFKQGVTTGGPQHILVPADQADQLELKLAELKLQPAPTAATAGSYQVRKGDTLSAIASRHGTSVSRIQQLNNLKNTRLRIGQQLRLDNAPAQPAVAANNTKARPQRYQVRSGDTLSTIASRHGVSLRQLRQWNPGTGDRLKVGQQLHLQPASTRYVIKPGDTLSAIAQRHKVSVRQLQNWNPSQSKLLKPGQSLTLYL